MRAEVPFAAERQHRLPFGRSKHRRLQMKTLYRAAQVGVSIARLIAAAFYFAMAIVLLVFALWLAMPFGSSWFLTAIALLVGLQGAALGVKALEIFLTTQPP
jgi:hypothetical protein